MQFVLTEEQRLLQDQVRDMLTREAEPEALRRLITDGEGWKAGLWKSMADMGLTGAAIPEAFGGVGLGLLELCVVCEELGRTVAPVPYFSSVCMAGEAILLAGSDEQKARWLPGIASGETVATLAWAEGSGAPGAAIETQLRDGRLYGRKWPVPDAALASLCVVVARDDGGPKLVVADLNQSELDVTPLSGFDQLRQHASLAFDGAACEPLEALAPSAAIRELFDRLAVLMAFEQVGGAESALYMARDYTLERYIFGRQLGSYQAVKHKLADVLVMTELARHNATYAANAVAQSLADAPAAAATARLGATRAYEAAARENLQLHGGIGFTWEANCHFHYRRARLLALALGSAERWTDVLIDNLAGGADASAAA